MRIKEAAAWNQTETDWHNLLRLAPETCFGLECDGVLAATVTAVCYERRLAWIGMVLTDPAHRRRGFARRLMEHAIEALTARQMEWIKLDATEMGAPLYRQLGFEPECGIERWGAAAAQAPGMPDLSWQDQCRVLDRQPFRAARHAGGAGGGRVCGRRLCHGASRLAGRVLRSMCEPPAGNRRGTAGVVSGPASPGTCLLGSAACQHRSRTAGARLRICATAPPRAHGAARRAGRTAAGPRRFAGVRYCGL